MLTWHHTHPIIFSFALPSMPNRFGTNPVHSKMKLTKSKELSIKFYQKNPVQLSKDIDWSFSLIL